MRDTAGVIQGISRRRIAPGAESCEVSVKVSSHAMLPNLGERVVLVFGEGRSFTLLEGDKAAIGEVMKAADALVRWWEGRDDGTTAGEMLPRPQALRDAVVAWRAGKEQA